MNLGNFSKEEKQELNTNLKYKKKMSELMKKGRAIAKPENCYYCGKKVDSFCNSHSVPAFCLRNISADGDVLTLNTLIDNPFLEKVKGVKKAGTFQLICRECDSKIFSDYENPDNYLTNPTSRMVAQIALKNALKSISKRLFENGLFSTAQKEFGENDFYDAKFEVNELDLKEYIAAFEKAKKSLSPKKQDDYYVCYYEVLDYVVPIAFQNSIALVFDFEGNVINDIYNPSPEYEIKNINICVFPLESTSVIMLFIDEGDKRYRKFYKQFNKLNLEDKLSALTFIMFAYSEDIYFSKTVEKEVIENQKLCDIGKSSTEIVSLTPYFNPLDVIKETYDLNRRNSIPNLLSEKYKVR